MLMVFKKGYMVFWYSGMLLVKELDVVIEKICEFDIDVVIVE